MRRNWILSAVGVLLALATVHFALELGSPRAEDEVDGLEPATPEASTTAPPAELVGPDRSTPPATSETAPSTRVSLAGGSREVEILGPHTEVFVHGTVTSDDGMALDRARLRAFPARGEKLLTVHTDESGKYRIGPLAPGSRRLHVDGADCYRGGAVLALDGRSSLVRQDFQLRRVQKIAVMVVTSRGEPTVRAIGKGRPEPVYLVLRPVATREDPGAASPVDSRHSSEPDLGRFRPHIGAYQSNLSEKLLGTLTLREPGATWLSLMVGPHLLRKRPIDPSVREVTFVIDPGELVCEVSGRLVAAESGFPLAGRVWLSESGSRDNWSLEIAEDGFLRFEAASPAARWLIAAVPGRVGVRLPLTLVPGEPYECGSIQVHEPITLSGRVTAPGGRPRSLALRWGLTQPTTGNVVWDPRNGTKSKADGSFVISGLVPGDYVIASPRCRGNFDRRKQYRVAGPLRVDATLGSVEGIEISALPTTIVVLIVSGIEAKQSVDIEVLDVSGFVVAASVVTRKYWRRVLQLLPGAHELVLSSEGKEVHRRSLLVGSVRERIVVEL